MSWLICVGKTKTNKDHTFRPTKFMERIADLIRKGIKEAELELQKQAEEELYNQGVMTRIPIVGNVWNWWYAPTQPPVQNYSFQAQDPSSPVLEQPMSPDGSKKKGKVFTISGGLFIFTL